MSDVLSFGRLRSFGIAACVVALSCGPSSVAQLPAFPGAQGFGAYAGGGRGGDVYQVINLNSSGPGSLREGIETAPSGGRTIVFGVSGYIPINYNSGTGNQTLRIVRNNVTIAGQSAPGDGIGLKDGRILITGNNVVLRHLRIRHGKSGGAGDCLNVESSADSSIIDHLSMQFSTDENISFFNSTVTDFTMQWSVSAWGLESHNAGGLWDLEDGTCHHSLWAHHHTRNPKARPYGLLEWINNVTFDWGIGFIMGDSTTPADWKANVVGSYFLSPPTYTDSIALEKALVDRNGNPNFSIHLNNCLHDADGDGLLNGTDKGYAIVAGSEYMPGDPSGANRYVKSVTPFAGSSAAVSTEDPLTAYKKVISQAGALRLDATHAGPIRDEVDTVLFNNVVSQQHSRISSESALASAPYNVSNNGFGTLNGAVAPTDTDWDGMPDFWEVTLGSDVSVDDHNNPVAAGAYIPNVPAGYTLLEEYLHFLAIPHAVVPRNTVDAPSSLSVDLRRFVRGFNTAPVVFTFSNVANGNVALQPDGYTAVFTPTPNFAGRARFDFTVTDGDGSAWTQTLAVLVSAVGLPRDLKWKGDGGSNLWNTNALNFLDGTSATSFGFGDNVLFDDRGFNVPGINISGGLSPGVVQVDASQDYTFIGSGALGGAMSLLKSGSGSLSIGNSGPNTFGGGATLTSGAVTLTAAGALGTGPVRLENEATLNLGTYSLASGNALTVSGSPTLTGGNGGGLTDIHNVSGSGVLNITVTTGVLDLQGDVSGFNGEFRFSGGNSVRFYGSTGGAAVAFDLGTGTLTLNKRSTAGTITLGALSGGANTTLQGASGGGNTSATTYAIGAKNVDTTFAGSIVDGQGTTSLNKTGSGVLTLTGDNTYSGTTTVSGGALLIEGSNGPGAVTVNSGAALGGTGAIGGGVIAQTGAALVPGSLAGEAGVLNVGNGLDLSGATLRFDLSSNPASGNDRIEMIGGTLIYRLPAAFFEFNLRDGMLGEGTYTLIAGGAGTSAPGSPSLGHNLPSGGRQTFSLVRSSGGSTDAFARLVVSGVPGALLWEGGGGSDWDLGTTHWLNGGSPDRFYNFDAVTFDDSGANGNVTIVGSLQPLSVIVSNSSLAYTFSGGTLDGPMKLTKAGSGMLQVNNTFGHTGGTRLLEGTLALAANSALGLNPVTLSGGALAPVNGDFLIPLVVEGSGTFLASSTPHTYVKAPITGNGVLTVMPSGNIWTYESDLSGFTGTIVLSGAGSLRLNQGAYVWGSPHIAFDLGSSATLNNRATTTEATVRLGALSGGAGSTLQASQQPLGTNLVDTYVVGSLNLDTTFSGSIVDGPNHALALSKVGSGSQTLNGTSSYSGGTVVHGGGLMVNNAAGSGTGSGPVLVHAGALLGGSGSLAGGTTLEDGAILAPGTTVGTLTFDGDLTLNEFSLLRFELGATSDRVVVQGDVFAAGQIEITDAGGFGPGVYTLVNWNTDQTLILGTLTLGSAPEGYDYTFSTATPGQIDLVVASPTPPSFDVPTRSEGHLILSGSGGVPGLDYYLLTSTNVALPVAGWLRCLTNQFDESGQFSITNPLSQSTHRQFFRLELP